MKKWTKAAREEASRQGKARWAARKKRDVRISDVNEQSGILSGGSANASSYTFSANQVLAIDVVKLIAHDVPADVIVKVVERILRP